MSRERRLAAALAFLVLLTLIGTIGYHPPPATRR